MDKKVERLDNYIKDDNSVIVSSVTSGIITSIIVFFIIQTGQLQGNLTILLILVLCASTIVSFGIGAVIKWFYKIK